MKVSSQAPVGKLQSLATGAAVFAALALLAFGLVRIVPGARTPAPPLVAPAAPAAMAVPALPAAAASRPLPPSVAAARRPEAKPHAVHRGNRRPAPRSAWDELTARQQQALRPLADHWATMSPEQRQKLAAKAPPRIRSAAPSLRPLAHPEMRQIRPARPALRREASAKRSEEQGAGTPTTHGEAAIPTPANPAAATAPAPQPVNPNTLLPAALRG